MELTLNPVDSCERLVVPEGVTCISGRASADLREVVFPKSLRIIKREAFFWCDRLTRVEFAPGSCVTIGNSAFAKCTALREIHLPNVSIGFDAFRQSGLRRVSLQFTEDVNRGAFGPDYLEELTLNGHVDWATLGSFPFIRTLRVNCKIDDRAFETSLLYSMIPSVLERDGYRDIRLDLEEIRTLPRKIRTDVLLNRIRRWDTLSPEAQSDTLTYLRRARAVRKQLFVKPVFREFCFRQGLYTAADLDWLISETESDPDMRFRVLEYRNSSISQARVDALARQRMTRALSGL